MQEQVNLTAVLDYLEDSAAAPEVRVAEVLQGIGERGFGPLVLVPALIVLLPTGAVPGVPTFCAALIILLSGQLVCGRRHPWLPARLRRVSVSGEAMQGACRRARPLTRRVDRVLRPRFGVLTRSPVARLVALVCVLLAATMAPLELLPFAAAVPAATIGCLALGMSARDGLLVLIGLLGAVAASWAIVVLLL